MHTKLRTPVIPKDFRNFPDVEISIVGKESAYWRNAFGEQYVGPQTKNFYPTETLFGDWDSELLLLAQDAAPAQGIIKAICAHKSNGEMREVAWRHAEKEQGDRGGLKTNRNLKKLVLEFVPNNRALYGSAAANMLFDDPGNVGAKYRQSIKGFHDKRLQDYLQRVMRWVVKEMPNLKYVMCLGVRAWEVSIAVADQRPEKTFKRMRDDRGCFQATIGEKLLQLIPAYHPAANVSQLEMKANWKTLGKLIILNRAV